MLSRGTARTTAGWLAGAAAAVVVVVVFARQAGTWPAADLDVNVYREAALAHLRGSGIYAGGYGPAGLPFTYPPLAVLVLLPLAVLPAPVAAAAMFCVSLLALTLVVRWCQSHARPGAAGPWWTTVLLSAAACLLLEPVRTTLGFGQVNLVLLALVLGADARGRRRAGWGAGVAAAVKVTPALLVLAQGVRGDARALARGVVACAVATGVAAVVLPSDTLRYFTQLLWDAGRSGNLDYLGNQSLRGLVERHDPAHAGVAWFVAAVAVLAVGAVAVRRQRDDPWYSLTIAAVTGLLVSPISWNHHWVWMLPCLAVGVKHGRRSPVAVASWAMLVAVLMLDVGISLSSSPVFQDPYVLAGLLWLGTALVSRPVGRQDVAPVEADGLELWMPHDVEPVFEPTTRHD